MHNIIYIYIKINRIIKWKFLENVNFFSRKIVELLVSLNELRFIFLYTYKAAILSTTISSRFHKTLSKKKKNLFYFAILKSGVCHSDSCIGLKVQTPLS
jgi:hypothetical protein